jgi:endonuclease YncB( thermonuclease family)
MRLRIPILILSLLLCCACWAREYNVIAVHEVTDGDTIVVSLDLGLDVTLANQKVRLGDIDTPELRPPKDQPDRELEITRAQAARAFLADMLKGQIIVIRTDDRKERESFERILAQVFIVEADGSLKSVAAAMLAAGHAEVYAP